MISLWTRSADNGYSAEGEDDTFAWSQQLVTGDFELSADVESDWENYGEAMVVVYGDGQGWTPGCLIFNVTRDWQSIRAHSVYDPEIEWVAEHEESIGSGSRPLPDDHSGRWRRGQSLG